MTALASPNGGVYFSCQIYLNFSHVAHDDDELPLIVARLQVLTVPVENSVIPPLLTEGLISICTSHEYIMILVQIYRGQTVNDEETLLFSDDNSDYAQQWAEIAEGLTGVDYVKVQHLEVT